MNNDLISKSKLLEALRQEEDEYEEAMTTPSYWSAIRIIKEQLIAYNVQKVDEQIVDYFKTQVEKSIDVWNVVDFSCDIRKIVRNGGNTDVPETNVGNNRWVLVSERMPNEEEKRQAYCRNHHGSEFVVMIDGASRPTTLYLTMDGFWVDDKRAVYKVIAWQPLPEPYIGEKIKDIEKQRE